MDSVDQNICLGYGLQRIEDLSLRIGCGLDEKMVWLRATAGRIDQEFLLIEYFGKRLIDPLVVVLLGL